MGLRIISSERIPLVTDDSLGIGRETCWHLAKEGATFVFTNCDETSAGVVVKELKTQYGKTAHISVHVSREDQGKAMIANSGGTFGRLGILVTISGYWFANTLVTT